MFINVDDFLSVQEGDESIKRRSNAKAIDRSFFIDFCVQKSMRAKGADKA